MEVHSKITFLGLCFLGSNAREVATLSKQNIFKGGGGTGSLILLDYEVICVCLFLVACVFGSTTFIRRVERFDNDRRPAAYAADPRSCLFFVSMFKQLQLSGSVFLFDSCL